MKLNLDVEPDLVPMDLFVCRWSLSVALVYVDQAREEMSTNSFIAHNTIKNKDPVLPPTPPNESFGFAHLFGECINQSAVLGSDHKATVACLDFRKFAFRGENENVDLEHHCFEVPIVFISVGELWKGESKYFDRSSLQISADVGRLWGHRGPEGTATTESRERKLEICENFSGETRVTLTAIGLRRFRLLRGVDRHRP